MHQYHAKMHDCEDEMDWDNLKVLLAISREGSLKKAARRLGMDQSTAGRKLSALEAKLGTILFVRSKAGFVLTEAGELAIPLAAEIEAACNVLIDTVASTENEVMGTVRLVGNPWTLKVLANAAMADFLALNPRLDIRMVATAPGRQTRGDATLSLWFEAEPREEEFSIELGQVPYAVYIRRGAENAHNSWVRFYDEDADRPRIALATKKLEAKDGQLRLTATDADVLLAAVRSGVGKGLLPMCLAEGDVDLVRVTPGRPEFFRTLRIHVSPDIIQTQRLLVTIDWLRAVFADVFLPSTTP